jgi:FemAB-related protein (PEP-CTERM system-associated)
MQIIKASNANKEEWDAFVKNHPEGSPFHLFAWHDAVIKSFGHKSFYYIAEDNGNIKGILPLFQVKSFLFGNIISSVPFAAYGGILADSDQLFQLLLEQAKDITRKYEADYLELKFFNPKECGLHETSLHYAFIKELSSDHDENMKAIPRKQRAMVRKGIKSGLTSHVGNQYLDDFYNVFAHNVHQLGTPVYPRKWFKTLLDVFGTDAEIMVIKHQAKTISGVLSIYYKDTILPYYAGSLMEYRKYAPNDFQYWELMRCAVERGCRYFDFGRSKKGSGHFSFKKNWGFEPQALHYQFYLHKLSELPEVNPLNPKYRKKIEAWKKLPHRLTKIIGPQIVKYIP